MALITQQECIKEGYSFIYGGEAIPYEVVRKPHLGGKKRRISIKVYPSCEVVISAPDDANRQDIHDAAMKRAKWIFDALKDFRSQQEHVQTKHYQSGEMQFYLGRRYVLKVVEEADSVPSVKMQRGKLMVTLLRFGDDKQALVKSLVTDWYRRRAEQVFHQRLNELLPQVSWVSELPNYRIMPMSKQWGSCSASGSLMLNPHLIKAPKECIDYVLLHELCHIAEHNHSDRFWRLLSSVMPHWQEVKSRLDGMAELYLNE